MQALGANNKEATKQNDKYLNLYPFLLEKRKVSACGINCPEDTRTRKCNYSNDPGISRLFNKCTALMLASNLAMVFNKDRSFTKLMFILQISKLVTLCTCKVNKTHFCKNAART
jgi:hypothetical protein